MKFNGFGIANYRSFGPSGEFVRDTSKVNVFIGKNNSGKSNILRFLKDISKHTNRDNIPWAINDHHKMTSDSPQIALCVTLDEVDGINKIPHHRVELSGKVFDVWMGNSPTNVERANSLDSLSDQCLNGLLEIFNRSYYTNAHLYGVVREKMLIEVNAAIVNKAWQDLSKIFAHLIYIPAIREIRTIADENTEAKNQVDIDLSGKNLVTKLRNMQHPKIGQDADQKKFLEIQKMICDLLDTKLTMEIPTEEDVKWSQ